MATQPNYSAGTQYERHVTQTTDQTTKHLVVQPSNQLPSETNSTTTATLWTTEVIIGASAGGALLLLIIVVIIIALLCAIRVRQKHRSIVHFLSPFDDIHMYTSAPNLGKDNVISLHDPHRVSKILCELNTSYECPHAIKLEAVENVYKQPTENIYACIY